MGEEAITTQADRHSNPRYSNFVRTRFSNFDRTTTHFLKALDTYRSRMSDFYGMAGIAKWCLDEPVEAVAQWRTGLKAQYADTAGLGIQIPLLLFCASVIKPAVFEKTLAEEILTKKTKDRRITIWHGPIGQWVLGQISENEILSRCSQRSYSDDVERHDWHWQVEFYRGVIALADRKRSVFAQTMRRLSDTSQPEWADEDFFLCRMWSEEFFLARHETER